MDPDPTRTRTPSDPARGSGAEESSFPQGPLADPEISPIPLASDPPVPTSKVHERPIAPTLESDVPLREGDEAPATGTGLGENSGAIVGGVGGAVTGGVIGAIVGGPVGAAAGGVLGAAAGLIAGDRSGGEIPADPDRAPGDMEEDDAFGYGGSLRGGSILDEREARTDDQSYEEGLEPDDRPAAGAPGPMAVDADAELRALDDPDDPHLPQDREIRP